MAKRLVIETQIRGALFFGLLKTQSARADGHAIAVLQFVVELLLTIDEDFVGTALQLAVRHDPVDDHKRAVFVRLDVRVMPRGARVVEHNLIVGRATNQAGRARVELMLRLASAGVGNF